MGSDPPFVHYWNPDPKPIFKSIMIPKRAIKFLTGILYLEISFFEFGYESDQDLDSALDRDLNLDLLYVQ